MVGVGVWFETGAYFQCSQRNYSVMSQDRPLWHRHHARLLLLTPQGRLFQGVAASLAGITIGVAVRPVRGG